MSQFWTPVLVIVAGYLGIVALMYVFQANLLYLPNVPSRQLLATPASVGLSYESVRLETADRHHLHGWFVPAGDHRAALIFFHGNAGNISHRLESLVVFHDLGLSTLIIDYRGYGLSEGTPSEHGTYVDAEAAWHFLTQERGVAAEDIVIFGRSLGASVAAHLASSRRPRGLIVESGFTSVPDLAAQIYPFLPARKLSRFSYDTRRYLATVSVPVLVVHSRDDELIPFQHGSELFEAVSGGKTFLELSGTHNAAFLTDSDRYVEGLKAFLELTKAAPGSSPPGSVH